MGRKLVEIGSRPDYRRSKELNRRPGRPGEGQGGPNEGHLDPNIGTKKKAFHPFHPSMVVKYDHCSLDRHCRMERIAMAIKLDHELRLTRRRSPDMQNFEADLSMMVPRPYESILGGKTPKYDFSDVAKIFWSKIGRDRVETGFLGVKPEAWEARRGPRRAK